MNWKLGVCTNLSVMDCICVVFVEGLLVDVFVEKILHQLVLIMHNPQRLPKEIIDAKTTPASNVK